MPLPPFMQALCTKICHDLATPLNAAALGVELIENPDAHAYHLIQESLKNAQNTLKFFRIICSHYSLENTRTLEALQPILQTLLNAKNCTVVWPSINDTPTAIHPVKIRLVALLTYLGPSFLPQGGTITLAPDLTMTFAGQTLHIPEHLQNVSASKLSNLAEPTPQTALFHFIYQGCLSLKQRLTIHTHTHQCQIIWESTDSCPPDTQHSPYTTGSCPHKA